MHPNKTQHVVLTLEGISYYQQDHIFDAYVDGFKELVQCLGFPRSMQLVLCFWCGLNPSICKQIDGMVEGHSYDKDIEGWIAAAYLMDQNAYAD